MVPESSGWWRRHFMQVRTKLEFPSLGMPAHLRELAVLWKTEGGTGMGHQTCRQ